MDDPFNARIAEAYGRYSYGYASILEPILRPMAEEVVRQGRLRVGELVLDLATGTGLIARIAAESKATGIGIDISLGMLTTARTLSAGRIPLIMGDAHKLPFRDQCFHLVTCGLSLSHFSDVSLALGEVLRVLYPEGRFITSAWGTGGDTPSKAAAVQVRRRFLEDRDLTFGGTFDEESWANPELGCAALRQAGFEDVHVKTLLLSGEYRNRSDAIEAAMAWPLTQYRVAGLDPEDQRRLKEETASAILAVDDLRWQNEIHYYQAVNPGRSLVEE